MKELFSYRKRQWFLMCIYLFVNALFLLKYTPAMAFPVLVGYVVVALIVFYALSRDKLQVSRKWIFYGMAAVALTVIFLIKYYVTPLSVQVDRWSAMFYWARSLCQGVYPYAALTHMDHYASPFPVWELVHFPFYFLGDEIFAHIAILSILAYCLYLNRDKVHVPLFLFLLFLSPSYWWEVLVRSDLFNNLLVVSTVIVLIERHKKNLGTMPFAIGFLVGLMSCSRLFAFIPLMIYFTPYLIHAPKKNGALLLVGIFLGFTLPFVPFLIWDYQMLLFFPYSPIGLQIRQGTILTFFVGLIAAGIISLLWKNFSSYLALSASVLFGFILMMFMRFVIARGWAATIYLDAFDISYFNAAMPFVLYGISYKNTPKSSLANR